MPTAKVKFQLGDEVYLAHNERKSGCLYRWVHEGPYKVCEIRITEDGNYYYVEGANWLNGYQDSPRFHEKYVFATEKESEKASDEFHNEELKRQMR